MSNDNQWDYTPLKSYLSELATFEEKEWEFLHELLYIKQFDTREYFQQAGRQCKAIGFISA